MSKKRKVAPAQSGAPVKSAASGGVPPASLTVVGVGASAGGLEAFTQFLQSLPIDTGMAFVLIQHLDPTHGSLLANALGRATRMPVSEAVQAERIEGNHVYVIPPGVEILIQDGALRLRPREEDSRRQHLPIDSFFRSLAAERHNHAIGVVLTGTASDGTEGLRAIKAEEGITFAQEPGSAKFDGMPRSAVDAGVVDFSLTIPEIARELARLSRHPYLAEEHVELDGLDDGTMKKIHKLVRVAAGVDFSEYKTPTFERRLARRMALRRIGPLEEYLDLLEKDPEESRALSEDSLIHVTSFFRDPEVFEALKSDVFPQIVKNKQEGAPIRIWVAGCSEGEEVYSIAMCLLEVLGNEAVRRPIQIFGTDVSERAIERARAAFYSESAMRDVSDERRRKFFTKFENSYKIHKSVRDLCVFVRHDLARDPPFSKLDLISCRNVLIYFGAALQKRVLPTFHYALNPNGCLVLGRTENIGGFGALFTPVDKTHKLFARTSTVSALQFSARTERHPVPPNGNARAALALPRRTLDLARQLDRTLVARYAPPGVLINEEMEILQFCGETGAYLRPASGEARNNILKMASGRMIPILRAAIARASKSTAPIRVEGVDAGQEGEVFCDLVVAPFTPVPGASEKLYIVLFEASASKRGKSRKKTPARAVAMRKEPGLVERLERELTVTKEYLQSLIDDRDRTNDELNAGNEELVSGNEELQSLNEEMETAKEELQSTNEELTTVNDELHSRNEEVSEINSDLVNILSTVDLPILILDRNRKIRRFTPKARSILNVLASDLGRPLDDIKSNLEVTNLDQQVAEVIESNVMRESEVRDRSGRWYRMQIRPFKTIDDKIDGATLYLVDIDALKHHVAEAQVAKADAERANRSKDDFLATLSHEIRTPLSSMLLQAQLLRRVGGDEEKILRAADAIERGTRLQVELIDDLLDVSRIVTGKLKIDLQPVNFRSVIGAAIEMIAALVERKKLKLKVALDETVGILSGDPTRLQQVVLNLLGNAIKFTGDGGQISIVLDAANASARLRITDTGIGIEPEFLPNIFNRFAQEDGSIGRRHGGLGLGLAIVHYLVEAHGGTIRAESPGRNMGTTLTVMLPITRVDMRDIEDATPREATGVRASRTHSAAGVLAPELAGLRVLVVDDDEATREALGETLAHGGALIRLVDSAAAALQAIPEFRPEILLCDIAMPGEDGYSLIRRVRALGSERGGDIPAVAITALAGADSRRRAIAEGYQMQMSKPVSIEDLMHAVSELSHEHRRRTAGT